MAKMFDQSINLNLFATRGVVCHNRSTDNLRIHRHAVLRKIPWEPSASHFASCLRNGPRSALIALGNMFSFVCTKCVGRAQQNAERAQRAKVVRFNPHLLRQEEKLSHPNG